MAKSWIVDSKALAKKVRHATLPSALPIKDGEAKRQCPNCHHWIDNSDVSHEWPGLPAGVKFDPSDSEMLEHLASKHGVNGVNPHTFIDEFIPTLDKGIFCTHPKDLPGATLDGSWSHFFHKTSNAYASGHRKRRKIQNDQSQGTVRWHKTGKTKPVFDNGVQKGCKKIMVLYASSKNGSQPVKSNWVMHQYHLGTEDDEKDDEFVVSKISYQKDKQTDNNTGTITEDSKIVTTPIGPKTPICITPNPPRESSILGDNIRDDSVLTDTEEIKCAKIEELSPSISQYVEDVNPPEYLAGESQAREDDFTNNDSFLCKELFNSCAPLDNITDPNDMNFDGFGVSDLNSIHLDTPPDFTPDVPFGSQDGSICNLWEWLK